MSEVRLSSALQLNTRLWRYMSLEKLLDLLATNQIFFSSLHSLRKSDPFEGYLPGVKLQREEGIVKDILGHSYQEGRYREVYKKSTSHIVVSCWHANPGESAAMWRIYSDNGKGIAIETTVETLKDAIESKPSPHVVHIHPVEYVDFYDKTEPKEGFPVPLLKRASYEHEKEVRALIYVKPPDLASNLKVKRLDVPPR